MEKFSLDFTPQEWEELVKVHTWWCEDVCGTAPLDPKMLEHNRRIARLVFKVLRRKGIRAGGMDMQVVEERERLQFANTPYCRAP
ncbi:MAG: hypothetical protein JETCAE01_34450 [Anaerolineaceae bacterium]|nr:MAG: hypothetical protein JETCAE01_34450 [Anaerolineaceae bacterium]